MRERSNDGAHARVAPRDPGAHDHEAVTAVTIARWPRRLDVGAGRSICGASGLGLGAVCQPLKESTIMLNRRTFSTALVAGVATSILAGSAKTRAQTSPKVRPE